VGQAATGTFTQKGGIVRIPYGGLSLGEEGGNGTYNLEGGVLNTPSITRGATGTAAFHWTGGMLHVDTFGTATVPFDLNQLGGVLAPGRSIGSTTIYGNYLQEEAGMLEIEIASPTNFDTVSVFGNAELHGDIVVKLLDGYIPAVGQTFPILSTTGSLDITNLGVIQSQAMAGGWILLTAPRQGGGELLILQAVPEPSSGSLALLGLAGLGLAAGYRLRRRRQGS
jgi:MYXO-CTERM domain-containing protein